MDNRDESRAGRMPSLPHGPPYATQHATPCMRMHWTYRHHSMLLQLSAEVSSCRFPKKENSYSCSYYPVAAYRRPSCCLSGTKGNKRHFPSAHRRIIQPALAVLRRWAARFSSTMHAQCRQQQVLDGPASQIFPFDQHPHTGLTRM